MIVPVSSNELLRDFQPDWIDWFQERCISVEFEAGDYMIEGGHAAAGLYVLLEGRVFVLSNHGERIADVSAGSVIGEMALVDGGLRSADVVAETAVATLLMTKPGDRPKPTRNRAYGDDQSLPNHEFPRPPLASARRLIRTGADDVSSCVGSLREMFSHRVKLVCQPNAQF